MEKKLVTSTNAPAPIGPYNQAVLAGGLLFISGQICLDAATGDLRNASIEEETHQVMLNLKAILAEAGMNFKNVVKTSIFLTDMGEFGVVNTVYGQYFEDAYPARETIQVSALPKAVNVEISMIALA